MKENFISNMSLKSTRTPKKLINTLLEIYSQLINLEVSDSTPKKLSKEKCNFILLQFIFLLYLKPKSIIFPKRHRDSNWNDIYNHYGHPSKIISLHYNFLVLPSEGMLSLDFKQKYGNEDWNKKLESILWGKTAEKLTKEYRWRRDHDIEVHPNQNQITLNLFEEISLYLNDQGINTKGIVYTPYSLALEIVEKSILNWIHLISPDFNQFKSLLEIKNYLLDKGKKKKARFLNKLNQIKILDPAMGTGIFLFAATNILLKFITSLNPDNSVQETKHLIIRNNVLGIDIDPLALQISMFKFWLWIYGQNEFPCKVSSRNEFECNFFMGNSLFGFQKYPNKTRSMSDHNKELDLDSEFDLKLQELFPIYELFIPQENTQEQLELLANLFPEFDNNPFFKFFIIEGHRFQWNILKNGLKEEIIRKIRFSTSDLNDLKAFKIHAVFSKPITSQHFTDNIQYERLKFHSIPNKFHWNDLSYSSFDLIVGNPPYIALTDLSLISRQWLKKVYPKIYTGNNDLSFFFIYRSRKILSEKGIMAFVLPKYLIHSVFAQKIRNFIKKSSEIIEIHDLTNLPVFRSTNISIVILFLRNQRSETNYSFNHYKYKKKGNKIIKEYNEVFKTNLTNKKWLLLDRKRLEVLKRIKNVSNKVLRDVTEISKGIETGCDRIFAPEKPLFFSKELKIHQDLYKPWIKGKDINRFFITGTGREVLFSPIYNRESIKKNAKVRNYLNQNKSYLMNRSRVAEYYLWRTGDERKTMKWNLPKIVTPYKANYNSFAIDWNGSLSSKDVVWIIPKMQYSNQDFLFFLMGILNSNVLTFFALNSIKDLGGIFEYYPRQIESFPLIIPKEKDRKYKSICELSQKLMNEHNKHHRKKIEIDLNRLIYNLYNLSGSDIELIKNSIQ